MSEWFSFMTRLVFLLLLISSSQNGFTQNVDSSVYTEGYFDFETGKVHYLDFGGTGMSVVFIPSNDRTAFTFEDFAPRFTDQFRVLAITLPGSGKSDGPPNLVFANFDLKTEAVIELLNHLNIKRAVLIDRHFHVPVYLAERYPDRAAGVVMMNGSPPDPYSLHLEEMIEKDETRILEMTERWNQSTVEELPDLMFEPEYIKGEKKIAVPTLMLRHNQNDPLWERDYRGMLEIAQWSVENPEDFPDSLSREYIQRLARDSDLQQQVKAFYETTIQGFWEQTAREFHEAFTEVRIVELSGEEDYGYYHYMQAPDMIEQPLRDFLHDIQRSELSGN